MKKLFLSLVLILLFQNQGWCPPINSRSSGLLGCWTFSEGQGVVTNDSLGLSSGAIQGCSWVSGMGNALYFDGVNDWVENGNEQRFDIEYNNPISLVFLAKHILTAGTSKFIISKFDGASGIGWAVSFFAMENMNFTLYQSALGSGANWYDTRNLLSGSYKDVQGSYAVTYDGNNYYKGATFYINAKEGITKCVGSSSTVNSILNNGLLCFGRWKVNWAGGEYYNGTLDTIGFWNRKISAGEIAQFHQGISVVSFSQAIEIEGFQWAWNSFNNLVKLYWNEKDQRNEIDDITF